MLITRLESFMFFAVDRTRVRLTSVSGVMNSDYINANFIKVHTNTADDMSIHILSTQGYDEKKMYIATQG